MSKETAERTPEETAGETTGETAVEKGAAGNSGLDFVDAALQKAAFSEYFNKIHTLINKQKQYPPEAESRKQQGAVKIKFQLAKDGALMGEPVISEKSFYKRLNNAAILAVKKAAPYPPFPPELHDEKLTFLITVNFAIR